MIGEPLDVIGVNVYYASPAGLELPGPDDLDPKGAPTWIGWSGPAYLQLLADVARGMKQAPFLVTETNATTIGSSADELVPWPGQLHRDVSAARPRCPAPRVLALAHQPLRSRDVVGGHPWPTTCSRAVPIGSSAQWDTSSLNTATS